MSWKIALIATTVACVSTGCGLRKSSPEPVKVVARAFEFNLTIDALEAAIPTHLLVADSAAWAQRYLRDWTAQKTLVHRALVELPTELQAFDKEIELYHHTLLTYAYEEQYLAQHLDTLITESALAAFHSEHPELFILDEPVVKARWMAFPAGADWPRDVRDLKKLLRSENPEDLFALSNRCQDAGIGYDLDAEIWIPISKLQALLSVDRDELLRAGHSRSAVKLGDKKLSLLLVQAQLNEGDPSPTSLVAERIGELIIHRRRKRTLLAMREELVRSAFAENAIEIEE